MSVSDHTYVVALDVATTTGFARGFVGGNPEFGSVRFAKPGASDREVFHAALTWAQDFFAAVPNQGTIIAIERLLPPEVVRGQSNTKTIYRLAGLHGVIIAVAYEHEFLDVETPSTQEIRGHFIGMRNCRRERAKREVMRKCLQLGWNPKTDNEGDALAIWHRQCSQIDPKLALQVSPLFTRGVVL